MRLYNRGKTIKVVKFPIELRGVKGVRAYTEADIIKNDLLLLLSHKSRKIAEILLNFENDSCWI